MTFSTHNVNEGSKRFLTVLFICQCFEYITTPQLNDLTKGWQNLNPLSHPNATLVPQARQARASGENLNYTTLATLAPQARQAGPSVEILNHSLSH